MNTYETWFRCSWNPTSAGQIGINWYRHSVFHQIMCPHDFGDPEYFFSAKIKMTCGFEWNVHMEWLSTWYIYLCSHWMNLNKFADFLHFQMMQSPGQNFTLSTSYMRKYCTRGSPGLTLIRQHSVFVLIIDEMTMKMIYSPLCWGLVNPPHRVLKSPEGQAPLWGPLLHQTSSAVLCLVAN